MYSVGPGGCLAPGFGPAEQCTTPYMSNSWVMSQHITPLPPHHRPSGLGFGPASLLIRPQALPEPARSSPQVAGMLLRPTPPHRLTFASAISPTRQGLGNWSDLTIPPLEPRVTVCLRASARTSEAELPPITGVSHDKAPAPDSLTRQLPFNMRESSNAETLLDDPDTPPQDDSLRRQAGPVSLQNFSSTAASAVEGRALVPHPQTLQPVQGRTSRHSPPPGGPPWAGSLGFSSGSLPPDCLSQQQDEQQQQPGQRRQGGPQQQQYQRRQHEQHPHSEFLPTNGAHDPSAPAAPSPSPWQHPPPTARHHTSPPPPHPPQTLPQPPAAISQAAVPQTQQLSKRALRKRQNADRILLGNILLCRTWMEMQEMLRKHQQRHLEETRRAAAAAARVAARAPVGIEPALTSTIHLNTHRPPEPQPANQASTTSAFTARHLATALHVTAQLVPDPRALGSVERLQLGDFVAAMGRGLASQAAAAPLSPVDLTMALRALARLLGAILTPGVDTKSVGAPTSVGAAQQHGEEGALYDEMQDLRGFPGVRSGWSGARGEQEDEEDNDEAGGLERGSFDGEGRHATRGDDSGAHLAGDWTGGGASQRGLHVGWLDASWVDGLLGPSIEEHLEEFEPRHVSGVLWALATLRLRPRSDLLTSLCDRAAYFAAHTANTNTSSNGTNHIAAGSSSGHATSAPSPTVSEAVMTPQGLSLTLWSLARLGFQPLRSVLRALLAACEADMMAAAATRWEQGAVAHAHNGFETSEMVTGGGAVGGLGGAACSCMDLAQRCWALAVLGCVPEARWLDLAVTAFLARAEQEQVTGQSCSMLLWGLARLRWKPITPTPMEHTAAPAPAADTVAQSTAVQSTTSANTDTNVERRQQQEEEMLAERLDSHRAASTSGRSVAAPKSTAAIVAADDTNPVTAGNPTTPSASSAPAAGAPWGNRSKKTAIDVMRGGGTDAGEVQPMAEAAAAAAGVVVADGNDDDGVPAVRWLQQMSGLLEVVERVLGGMSSQHLATSVWAVAELGLRPNQGWLEAFLNASDRQLWVALTDARRPQPYGPQALAMTLGALARLRYRAPLRWILRFMQVCRKELPSFSAHATCTLAWALAHLSYRPPGPWARAFATHTQPLLPSMSPLGLSVLLWAVARWRINLPRPWLRTALMASAEQLRAGAECWERGAAALETAAASGAHGAQLGGRGQEYQRRDQQHGRPNESQQQQVVGMVLKPEQLTWMVWALPRLLQRRPPPAWMALADAATQAAIRHDRAAVAAATAANSRGVGGGPRLDVGVGLRDPSTLTMLLQAWAALRSPLAEGCLSYALSCIETAAAATVAAGPVSDRQSGLPTSAAASLAPLRLAAESGPGVVSSQAGAWLPARQRVGPQHVVLALWSCAVMGWVPPAGTLSRLLNLHEALLLQQCSAEQQHHKHEEEEGQLVEEGGVVQQEEGGLPSGSFQSTTPPQQHQRLAEVLAERQAELGMLLWTMLRCGVSTVPEWLPGVLAAVGARLEAAAAATTTTTGTAPVAPKPSSVTLLSLLTMARCCLAWGVNPGSRWIAAATDCLDAGVLGTRLRRRPWARAQLEEDARYLLEQLQVAGGEGVDGRMEGERGAGGKEVLEGRRRRRSGGDGRTGSAAETAWATAEAAAGGSVLTNAVAAMAAGSAAAWMQGLVW